jgi:hypothetical protein
MALMSAKTLHFSLFLLAISGQLLNSSVKTTVETGFSNTAPHRTGTAAHST